MSGLLVGVTNSTSPSLSLSPTSTSTLAPRSPRWFSLPHSRQVAPHPLASSHLQRGSGAQCRLAQRSLKVPFWLEGPTYLACYSGPCTLYLYIWTPPDWGEGADVKEGERLRKRERLGRAGERTSDQSDTGWRKGEGGCGELMDPKDGTQEGDPVLTKKDEQPKVARRSLKIEVWEWPVIPVIPAQN